ncbi:NADPH-dependent FMN reductase [Actinomyces bowdenii]|uniref:NAD(P)H-dependent oxidoreductase n=1 Tax=Actinomyces bowdenii TaxID=131109 RepID=A0A853ENZ9_9ACTO|nr:NAD(P)H-dependent oxidoreductase [Actinomyces bowdenii]MBF0697879.1 NAD(P)H-dependent oxidoreductase [Actinomyces bowdenii]MDO5064196.1 NAD(P)H-dependent oxidoreductase [Actinomyces bowdenii]NYS70052.1 NAD(P)H-dependent oxidoreductase [Actinomyces bowdenii]
MTRIAVVLGSVRPNRVGGSVAQWVVDQANATEGVQAELVDIAAFNLPVFAEEMPPMMAAPKDPAAVAFNEALSSYDAYIFVTPEYNRSIPGALKNAIDFVVPSVMANKAVGLVAYSYSNGFRPLEHLRDVLVNFTTGVVTPQVNVSLATDFSNGSFSPAEYHNVAAVVEAVVAQDKALSTLR